MSYLDIIEEFKKILEERFPSGYNYVPQLSEILQVHPKTISRKLSGETQFTLEEAIKIGKKLDISLEPLFNCGTPVNKHPMEIYFHDFSIEKNYREAMQSTLEAFTFASQSASSIYQVATNTIPDFVYARHEWIARFSYIKWLYFNKGAAAMISPSDIKFRDIHKQVQTTYEQAIFALKRSIYILHIDMMKHIVDELLFSMR